MFQNNNRAVINRITNRSLKVNTMRNLFAITAIVLTTVLFTSLFTIGMSMIQSLEYSTMRQVGTSAHGGFKHITQEQFEILRKHQAIKEYGMNIMVGIAEDPELAKRQVQIQYLDHNDARYSFITPITAGRMPVSENEIVLDTITMNLLGLSQELGQRVTLAYTINGEQYSSEFVLSGYYQGDKVSLASIACVSKDYVDKIFTGTDLELSRKNGVMAGLINLNIMLDNKMEIESKLKKILSDNGFEPGEIKIGVNWAYMGSGLFSQPEDLLAILGILFLILVSGYLIIYNIFYISVVKDIRFYGLLKTIGTTQKQLRRLIIKQAAVLSSIGIPVGLILGYLTGVVLTPFVLRNLNATHHAISASLLIFAGVAVFSLITVLISCYKPAKAASGISPVEAVRYTGVTINKKKVLKDSTHGARLHHMAFANLFRSRRKVILSILSLSLSMILLNSVYTMINGFDLNKFLKGMSGSDFTIGDASFYRWNYRDQGPNALTAELCDEVSQLNGVKEFNKIYYKFSSVPMTAKMEELIKSKAQTIDAMYRPGLETLLAQKKTPLDIYGIDRGLYHLFSDYVVDGVIDHDQFTAGNYAVVRKNDFIGDLYQVGDQITLSLGSGKSMTVSIMAVVDKLPLYLSNGRSIVGGYSLYISSERFSEIVQDPAIMTALFNVEKESISSVQHYLENKTTVIPALDYRSKASYAQEYQEMVNTFKTVGYTLSFIIAFIGLLNFVNVMITGILSRRQEFAMMQSIGMTTKQLRQMLSSEGLYYAIITLVVALAAGSPLIYFGINALTKGMPYFTYTFSILPIILCIPVLILIAMLVPVISYTNTNKTSVVERLREIS